MLRLEEDGKSDLKFKILILLVIGLSVRIIFAPYSSGSDIPQFAGFADTFRSSGLCFYVESVSPLGENWPYPWLYPYGPLLVLLLYGLRFLASSKVVTYELNGIYYVKVPIDWLIALKVLFVVVDSLIPVIIYLIVRNCNKETVGFLLALAYALNPMTIYNSAIYGMFDHIAFTFLLLSLMYSSRRVRLSGFLAGLSVLTKPTTLYPYLGMLIYFLFHKGLRKGTKWLLYSLFSIVVLFMPFFVVCPQTFSAIKYIVFWRGSAYYKVPLVYTINGITALATYLHIYLDMNTLAIIKFLQVVLVLLVVPSIILSLKNINIILIVFAWYVAFLIGFWGDNPQFLVGLIALGLLALGENYLKKHLKVLLALLVLVSSAWPLWYPVDFWFHVHVARTNKLVMDIAKHLVICPLSDLGYVLYYIFMYFIMCLTYVIMFINSLRRTNLRGEETSKN
jgi:hypothetical protein